MSDIPICRDCKHLIGKRLYTEEAKRWKCGHPKNIRQENKDPVSGELIQDFFSPDCYHARSELGECKPQGSLYEFYEPPVPSVSRPSGKKLPSADELLGELGQ